MGSAPAAAAQTEGAAASPTMRTTAVRRQWDRILCALRWDAERARRSVAVRAGAARARRLWLRQRLRQRERRQQRDEDGDDPDHLSPFACFTNRVLVFHR